MRINAWEITTDCAERVRVRERERERGLPFPRQSGPSIRKGSEF